MEDNKEVKLDEKVKVISIAPWITGARRIMSVGDISIQPNGTITLTREELIAQAQGGNKLLIGTDGSGSHATWYICDDWTRKELDFDNESKKQTVISDDMINKMFELKTMKAFEKNVTENIVTRAEKVTLMETIKKLKLNDYEKIKFCEGYTGNKI